MPKKQFKITDFSGGLNAYSDPRDILDTQFAQNWNASLDKFGVIRFSGAGIKYTTDQPHINDEFISGAGLFSFSTDISANVLDGTDLQKGFERGTVQSHAYDSGAARWKLTLAASPTYQSFADHATNDFYNDMIIHIYSGPGKGQTARIEDYVGSSKEATISSTTNFGLSDSTGTITAIEGVPADENVAAVAKLRVYAEGSNTYHFGSGSMLADGSFLGSLWPWSHMSLWAENLTFVDWVARGIPIPGFHSGNAIYVNNKYLVIKDRDGLSLTIFFVNAALASAPAANKFPTCTDASGTGSNHYIKVTEYQTSYTHTATGESWADGDRIFSENTNENFYLCNVQNRTAAETASDIAAIVNAEDAGSGINVAAVVSFAEDGKRTIITLTAQKGEGTFTSGSKCLDVAYHSYGYTQGYFNDETVEWGTNVIGQGNLDCELEVFQNFTGGLGESTASLTKLTCSGHSVNIGEYITVSGASESGYNDTHRVVWVEPNAMYIENTGGDSAISGGGCTFTSVPTSASKYIIYNLKSEHAATADKWEEANSFQGTSLISNKKISSTTAFSKYTP